MTGLRAILFAALLSTACQPPAAFPVSVTFIGPVDVEVGAAVRYQGVAVGEVVGVSLRQPSPRQPALVELSLGIEDPKRLFPVREGVGLHVLLTELGPGRLFPARIADHASEVADQENDIVTVLLKLPHLIYEYRMSDVQIRRSWIETDLHHQRAVFFQLFFETVLRQDFIRASGELGELLFH